MDDAERREIIMLQEIDQNPTILNRLRQNLVVVKPTTEEELRQKMNLIFEHRSEFPSKLRPAIEAATLIEDEEPEIRPSIFLSRVELAVIVFVYGQLFQDVLVRSSRLWQLRRGAWHGLNRDVDTEDEAELAIRFFPWVLTNDHMFNHPTFNHKLFFNLLSCSKAVFFIPLFLKVGAELFSALPTGHGFGTMLTTLLANEVTMKKPLEEDFAELDEECLLVLMRMRELDLMKKEDIHEYKFMSFLFEKMFCRELSFVETRLRLLIGWDPSIFYETFVKNFLFSLTISDPNYCLPVFEILYELGMSYFPNELGFVFHQDLVYPCKFKRFCESLGAERVREIVHNKLLGALGRDTTLQNLVFAAATNDEISLTGLYTVFRCDPMAFMPESSMNPTEALAQSSN